MSDNKAVQRLIKEKEPGHPLLAVFHPYLQQDKATLEKEASDYYNKIQQSSLSEAVKTSLSDVFIRKI